MGVAVADRTVMRHATTAENNKLPKLKRKKTPSLRKWVGLLAGLAVGTTATYGKAHAQYAGQLSSIVVDARTGAVLSQDDPDLRRYPASLTKLMTLYMTFNALRAGAISLDQAVPVSIHASTMEPSKLGLFPARILRLNRRFWLLLQNPPTMPPAHWVN